jgi:hypothetical protein
MYSGNPGDEAAVYRFDAVTANGEPVAFTPSATHRVLPSKLALVHLRQLSINLHRSSNGSDAERLAADQEALRLAIVAYVDIHNEERPDDRPASVEVSRVAYDVTELPITIASGDKTVLISVELDES